MKTLITILLILMATHYNSCKEQENNIMNEILRETPHAVVSTNNLFAGKGNEIRYYIVNPKDKRKVELIEEKAMSYSQEEQRSVVRVDSIHKANLIIKL
jgi:predicted patatin/cPLA2 family phospholipase